MIFSLEGHSLSIVCATLFLVAGVIDDVRTKKVHNSLILFCLALGIGVVAATKGFTALPMAFAGLFMGVAVLLPLVLTGIVGAGDMKLLAVFGFLAGWAAVFPVAAYGLVWGAVFGVLRSVINGQGPVLAHNLLAIVKLQERKSLALQSMPFTIALLMGWLTQLALTGGRG